MSDTPPPDDRHSVVPGPRPGFESRDEDDAPSSGPERMALLAASARSAVGVLCLGVALLYLPPNMGTPVLSGVAVLMVVGGCLQIWRMGRSAPDLRLLSRALVWFFPLTTVVIFVVTAVFGPSLLGPDWGALKSARKKRDIYAPVEFMENPGAR